MGVFDTLKNATSKAKDLSTSMAKEKVEAFWASHGDQVKAKMLEGANNAVALGKPTIAEDEKYKLHVIDPLWLSMPMPMQLIGRDRLNWDGMLFQLRSKVFLIEGEHVQVHPDAIHHIDALVSGALNQTHL